MYIPVWHAALAATLDDENSLSEIRKQRCLFDVSKTRCLLLGLELNPGTEVECVVSVGGLVAVHCMGSRTLVYTYIHTYTNQSISYSPTSPIP